MKLNYKVFKNLNNPVVVQGDENRHIEIHFMNDTPYFSNYVNRGQYAAWTSDGKSYKLLIEEGYYNEFEEIFTEEMNNAWIDYFEEIFMTRKRLSKWVWYPALILVLIIFGALLGLPRIVSVEMAAKIEEISQTWVLFGVLIVLILLNIINSSVFKKKAEKIQKEHFENINAIIGEEKSHQLALQQDTYHQRFMSELSDEPELVEQEVEIVDEPVLEEAVITPEITQEEVQDEIKEVEQEPEIIEEAVVEEVEAPVTEEVIEEPAMEVEPEIIEEGVVVVEELKVLKVDELREFAKQRKIANYSTMNKVQLIESFPSYLEELRVPELKAIAKANEYSNYSTLTKPELVYLIRNYEEIIAQEEVLEPIIEQPVVEVEPEVIEEVVIEEVISEEPKELLEMLQTLTVDVLRDFVKARKTPNYSTMNKTQLIESLPNELKQLRVPELKALAKANDYNNYSTLTKPELVKLLEDGPQDEVIEEVVIEEVIEEPIIEEVVEVEVVVSEGPKELLEMLDILTVDVLREFVKERRISNYSIMNKKELIEVLPGKLEELRVIELKALAKANEYSNYSTLTKPELIELLTKEEVTKKIKPNIDLSILTVKELRDFAKQRKITNVGVMNKTQLVEVLPKLIEELKVEELKAIAKKLEIVNYSNMVKNQLVEAIKEK